MNDVIVWLLYVLLDNDRVAISIILLIDFLVNHNTKYHR